MARNIAAGKAPKGAVQAGRPMADRPAVEAAGAVTAYTSKPTPISGTVTFAGFIAATNLSAVGSMIGNVP
jgi:hypothetical protein